MDTEQSNLSYQEFVRARKLHWMQEAQRHDSEFQIPRPESTKVGDDDSNFIISARGMNGLHAVLEDGDETGWFYIYDSVAKCILKATHVYNRSNANVAAEDVDVGWSTDGDVCCVAIWEQMRAFLGVKRKIQMRRPITDSHAHGFYASEWPEGFSHYLLNESKKE